MPCPPILTVAAVANTLRLLSLPSKVRGSIEIRFFSDDELERVLEIVGVKVD